MGEVYEALNRNTGRRVAIKTLHGQAVGRPDEVARFIREARVVTRIEHPNVVQVLDLDVDPSNETPYIVQELLTGESLEAELKGAPGRKLSPSEALRIAEPVVSALVAAHELGVVHRDLKPANIFLAVGAAGEPTPKVIDFGIAKLLTPEPGDATRTQTGALIGSPAYMSPEQACGAQDIDALTDVWSMGVVLYQMLSGRLPYEGGNAHMCIGMLQTQEPTPLRERAPRADGVSTVTPTFIPNHAHAANAVPAPRTDVATPADEVDGGASSPEGVARSRRCRLS